MKIILKRNDAHLSTGAVEDVFGTKRKIHHSVPYRYLGRHSTAPLICRRHIICRVVQFKLEVGFELFTECDIHILAKPQAL